MITSQVRDWEQRLGLPLGVAIARGGGVRWGGSFPAPVAWSTSKVPVALAAARARHGGAPGGAWAEEARAAITWSDNAAAQRLWEMLGDDAQAARATTALLRDLGDEVTVVPRRRLRPPFTVFGQTTWHVRDQAVFAQRLPDADGASEVLELMGQIVPEQRIGLARLDGMRFKGGWGPDPEGTGTVCRQLGMITAGGEPVGVSLAVHVIREPDEDRALARLDDLAELLVAELVIPG